MIGVSSNITSSNTKRLVRSNANFLKRGLEKTLYYNKRLAATKNPDHFIRFPNEVAAADKKDFVELTKRCKKEWESMLNVQAMRLRKKTGKRRIEP